MTGSITYKNLGKNIEWYEREWGKLYMKHYTHMKPYLADESIYRRVRKNVRESKLTEKTKKERLAFLTMYRKRWGMTQQKHKFRMEDPKINERVTSKLFTEFKKEGLIPGSWSLKHKTM